MVYFFIFFLFLFFCLLFIHFSGCSSSNLAFSKRYNLVFLFIPFSVLAFLMGFRHEVGADYWNYLLIFERFEANDAFIINRFEPGFLAILNIVSSLELNGNFFLFICYLFTVLFFWGGIYYSRFDSVSMISLSVILFLGIGPVFSATNTVRQSLAISIVIFIITFLSKRKKIATILSSAIGFLFHYSAPLVLVFNFVPTKSLGFKFWLFVSFFCVLLSSELMSFVFSFLQANRVFLGDFSGYFDGGGAFRESSGLGLRLVLEIIIFLFLSLYVKKINPKGLWFFNIAFFGILLAYVFKDYAMFLRGASYFSVFKILAIPWFLKAFKGLEKQIFFFGFTVYSLSAFARSAAADQFAPFKIYFFS